MATPGQLQMYNKLEVLRRILLDLTIHIHHLKLFHVRVLRSFYHHAFLSFCMFTLLGEVHEMFSWPEDEKRALDVQQESGTTRETARRMVQRSAKEV